MDSGPPTPRVRARSRVACVTCNRRKVRCNVAQTGPPCTNCRDGSVECVTVPRKKHKPRRSRAAPLAPAVKPGVTVPRSPPERAPTLGPSGEASPSRLTPEADGRLPDDDATSYIGDNRGPRQSVYELCHPQTPQDARLPDVAEGRDNGESNRASSLWAAHELAYLRHEGAFQTLPPDLSDGLVRVYFEHVHFFMPILDAADVLRAHTRHGAAGLHPLLCWSMCLAAANFVSDDVLAKTGYASRKAMKQAMYARAKCLYDLDRSTDKVTLIQAVLLMGFWYTDAYDHTGAWHWVGIAISLAQSLGFHRKPTRRGREDGGDKNHARRASLVRRIWWTCLVRDRWVALAKGRPMRIHDEDCDVPRPVLDDFSGDLDAAASPAFQHLVPAGGAETAASLARMWLRLVTISALLGRIVRAHYRVQGLPPSLEDMDAFEKELRACGPSDAAAADDPEMADHLRLHAKHVDLFYNATAAILYRPYLLQAPASLPRGASPAWQRDVARRARAAAARTNDTLNTLIELDAIHQLKPMTITALVPAMQIHLFDFCKAATPLLRSLGKNKLGLCLLVLSHIRRTYWSASVIHRLFSRAQQILQQGAPATSVAAEEVADRRPTATETAPKMLPEPRQREQNMRERSPTTTTTQPICYETQQHPPPHQDDTMHSHSSYDAGMPTPTPTVTPTSSAQPFAQHFVPSLHQSLPPSLPHTQHIPSSLPHPQQQPALSLQQPDAGWWDEPATFWNVDLLLSPGFALSDDVYQTLFETYSDGSHNANATNTGSNGMSMVYMQ
ncbi:hypothetical protein SPBR_00258 [Sporothrix brasiliensis 5110]|uniref:Zn(2)-C6 fungal-type domain-containing protein n=1 Tax=Sporothrix brasiliensis 5110 TaxID=1398154 RepID=A0A0C2ILI5_9PEZI|nr:uncharacterized protein SPBR_00258 [Sporothrix brasiliensis 5110]KIH89951.1 hypothetical protein SPBR_00258 [Sporothrix brasiliensis 5110]